VNRLIYITLGICGVYIAAANCSFAQTNNQGVAGVTNMIVIAQAKFRNANELFDQKKYADALKAFSDYLVEFPFEEINRETTLFRIAEAYRQLGRNVDALQGYQTFADSYPESTLYPLAAVRLGDLLSIDGKYQDALVYYSTVLTKTQDQELKNSAQFASARTLQALGKGPEAAEKYAELTKIRENNPYLTISALAAANLFYDAGDFTRAIPFYQSVKTDDSKPILQMEASNKLGNYLMAQKNYKDAAGEFRFARNLTIDDPSWRQWASLQLLQCMARSGDSNGVLLLYETPGETFPAGSEEDVWLMVCQAARASGDDTKALKYYDQYLKKYADAPNADVIAYDRLFIITKRKNQEISGIADTFLLKYPKSAYTQNARYLIAREKIAQKDFQSALKSFDEMVKSPIPAEIKPDVLYERARIRLQFKNYPEAVEALKLFTLELPDDKRRSQALYQLALAQQAVNQNDDAVATLGLLLKSYPKAPEREDALAQLALLNGQLGRKKELRGNFLALMKEFPESKKSDEANYWVGWSFAEEQDFVSAMPYLKDARGLNDKDYGAKATFRMILALYALQKPEELSREIYTYEKYKTTPDVPAGIYGWLAEKFFTLGHYAQAVPFYERLLNADDATPDMKKGGLLQLGRAQIKAELYEDAVVSLEKYVKIYNKPEEQVICLLELSTAYRGAKQFAKARSSAEKVMEFTGEGWANAEARLLLGKAYFDEGKPEEAVKYFKSVALLYYDPQIVPQAMTLLAEAYGRLGKTSEKNQTLKDLKERFPTYSEE